MNEGRLSGKTAVVTGSGQNIGRAIALRLAGEGANLVVNGLRDRAKVDAVVMEIHESGGSAIGVMADVSKPPEVERLVESALDAFGNVDVAVSNVAQRRKQPFEEITIEDWHSTLATNLHAAFYLAHFVLPRMRERRYGRLIHISGYDGFTGHLPQRAHNVTAKAGLHGLAKAIAREYGRYGITCNTVVPGAIATTRDWSQYAHVKVRDIFKRLALRRPGTPEDIAEACLFLAANSGKYVTGQAVHVNGGEFMF